MKYIALFVLLLAAAGFRLHVRFRKDETDEEWERDDNYFE